MATPVVASYWQLGSRREEVGGAIFHRRSPLSVLDAVGFATVPSLPIDVA